MATAKYKCSRCDRTFSMPAHLARHKNTIHAVGARKKKVKGKLGRPKGTTAKKPGRPKVRVARTGAAIGLGAPRFLGEMKAYQNALLTQRASLDSQIDAVGRALNEMGLSTTATRRATKKRAKPKIKAKTRAKTTRTAKAKGPAGAKIRTGSLRDYIGRVLKQRTKPMSPAEIGTSVVKAGFKTKAKDITKAVSNTIPKMSNVKKVGFGKYKVG